MRYQVIEGSVSCHCCFGATVVDTTRPFKHGGYEEICECFNPEDAELICELLNKANL